MASASPSAPVRPGRGPPQPLRCGEKQGPPTSFWLSASSLPRAARNNASNALQFPVVLEAPRRRRGAKRAISTENRAGREVTEELPPPERRVDATMRPFSSEAHCVDSSWSCVIGHRLEQHGISARA